VNERDGQPQAFVGGAGQEGSRCNAADAKTEYEQMLEPVWRDPGGFHDHKDMWTGALVKSRCPFLGLDRKDRTQPVRADAYFTIILDNIPILC
jgi:hypothetical protein